MASEQWLLSLPKGSSTSFAKVETRRNVFAASDPGGPIGSGGGAAQLLVEAWRATGSGLTFREWLHCGRKVIVHSGGQSRRLPAYAAVGKTLLPAPVERGKVGQRPDQQLLDLQMEALHPVLRRLACRSRVIVTSGDALMRTMGLPAALPEADVVGLGFDAPLEDVTAFGAFFVHWGDSNAPEFFLQKAPLERLMELQETHRCLADSGVWALSEDAVMALLYKCGWQDTEQRFAHEYAENYELYSGFGLSLGTHPTEPDPDLAHLSCAVVPVGSGFYHFGTSRQLIEAVTSLHNAAQLAATGLGLTTTAKRHNDRHAQNVVYPGAYPFGPDCKVWVENCWLGPDVTLDGDNVLTGVPSEAWGFRLLFGSCLDVAPIGDHDVCLRHYGFDDSFSGEFQSATWMGRPALEWLKVRNLDAEATGIDLCLDIQRCPLFPVQPEAEVTSDWLNWLIAAAPVANADFEQKWLNTRRLSAFDLLSQTNIERIYTQRADLQRESLSRMLANSRTSVLLNTDLEISAKILTPSILTSDAYALSADAPIAQRIRERMFRSVWMRERGEAGWKHREQEAFEELRNAILRNPKLRVAPPHNTLIPDQIVWVRSPLRLDLAGGWTDTPPYCMLFGGRVVNVAVELNGQPSVQVFARALDRPEIVLRSIDIGTETHITEYDDITEGHLVGSEFSLAKAALALAGFLPRFCCDTPEPSLRNRLEAFGGGLEISMLAAVPKGSGLGTSSILSAALLTLIGDACGHGWGTQDVFDRVLASEQLLTSGGGWQDQAGALWGIKEHRTNPGQDQRITTRWLPNSVLDASTANSVVLLYYTGIKRVAKGVLAEIVRGMFLNSHDRLAVLSDIGENVEPTVDALSRGSYSDLGQAIHRSWELNQRLDSGTNPLEIACLFDAVEDYVLGAKLLGAGGGGYMLMLCKDIEAAARARLALAKANPAPGARFVDFAVAEKGLSITRS